MRAWPLGLACVAQAVQDAGHEVIMIDMMETTDFASGLTRHIEDFQSDLIGISVRNIDDQGMVDTKTYLDDAKGVVQLCRELTQAPIVLGGAGYSICPHSILEFLMADMGIQGEGETAIVDLLDHLKRGTYVGDVPGLYRRYASSSIPRTLEMDLDRLPLPDHSLLPSSLAGDENFWLPIQTRRGCPMGCSYCSTMTIEGSRWRFRSPENIVRWLTIAAEKGFKQFFFVDNTFNLPSSYAKRLCREIVSANLGLSWHCIVYPLRLDSELVELMAAAGCKEVSLGFESGSESILRLMRKKFSLDSVRQASNLFAEHGINRLGFLLLGGPGESKQTVLESLRFADSLNLERLRMTVGIRIYPHTELAVVAEREGMISPGNDLMEPSFYLEKGLEDWLRGEVQKWLSERPHWFL